MALYDLARTLLFAIEAEDAHELTLRSLERGLYRRASLNDDSSLQVEVAGLPFPNPVGIAAGFDKDARVPDAVLGLGCGFAEIGTVTPRPQPGNPRPRVFRLKEDRAVINRLGFNNQGHAAALRRLRERNAAGRRGIVGVNIGANKDSEDRTADYVQGLTAFYDVASYFTVNISSPNTPGLRDLQAPAALDELLRRVMAARAEQIAQGKPRRPVFVKIAPDIAMEDLPQVAERLLTHASGRRDLRIEHNAGPAASFERPQRRGGRSLRPASVPTVYDRTLADVSGDGRTGAADRYRRDRQRCCSAIENRGGCKSAAALYRPDLRRTVLDR